MPCLLFEPFNQIHIDTIKKETRLMQKNLDMSRKMKTGIYSFDDRSPARGTNRARSSSSSSSLASSGRLSLTDLRPASRSCTEASPPSTPATLRDYVTEYNRTFVVHGSGKRDPVLPREKTTLW
eukprot:TRINITY_DN69417_c0_g1_i1.p1 TRINITY_DN69417_c0_g1~~TRINITY_DN69417_c0_g1_i1.p1  ORF type:complete len:124 (+),score=13.18 TRINITY_DN69417_c0_g1_i1:100-471(+)